MKVKSRLNISSLICLAFFLIFGVLCFLFPYTGDDWAWGSSIGVERLRCWFADYNGRYLGNIWELIFSRLYILRSVLTALFVTLTLYLIHKLSSKNFTPLGLISIILLFFAMPYVIFRQSVVWSAGYVNYGLPALNFLLYIYIVRNIFEEGTPRYGKSDVLWAVLLGFAGSLYVEHVTIYQVAAAVIIIIYTLIRFKKAYLTHFAFLFGSIAGAVCMFANGAYGLIASDSDEYRTMADGIDGYLSQAIDNYTDTIQSQLFYNNAFLFAVITVLLFVIVVRHSKPEKAGKGSRTASYILMSLNFFATLYTVIKKADSSWGITDLFDFAVTCILLITLIALPAVCLESVGEKSKAVFAVLSVIILTVPLLAVTPIGSRCFLPQFFMLLLYIDILISSSFSEKAQKNKILIAVIFAVVLGYLIFWLSIYGRIYKYDTARISYARQQDAQGAEIIYVFELPGSKYLWCSSPSEEIWAERFKLFYGLNPDAEIKVVSFEEFIKLTE